MKIVNSDCLEYLKQMPDNSIDAIVTDPPYGLSFMGKKWDYDVPSIEIWEECLRVLKPGGYLLAFAGTRTQHRMAVRIEDAGFEIRDMIAWIYGSGFPKSLNIANAIAKRDGAKRDGAKRDGAGTQGNTFPIKHEYREYTLTDNAKQWEGWGTSLKPALEPISVCRKPLEKGLNVAQNCLKWGVGGINIDGCRVGTEEMKKTQSDGTFKSSNGSMAGHNTGRIDAGTATGRFPANLIHDGSDEVVGLFPQSKSTQVKGVTRQPRNTDGVWDNKNNGLQNGSTEIEGYSDSGSAARYFYCAKASKSERNRGLDEFREYTAGERTNREDGSAGITAYAGATGASKNFHPTVKPIALMEYLVKLVSKEGHTVLDPFMGSGSTGIACKKLGREFIGIEKESDYCKIAEARIGAVQSVQEELL
jgi:DNA modification methylase